MIKMHIPEAALELIQKLKAAGYQAVLIGGCVRDAMLKKPPSDYDLATDAQPDEIERVFFEYHCLDHGKKHGTITVLSRGEGYEITTYRIDGKYTDGRHPDAVEFTPSLCEDIARRDFTINALAYDTDFGLIDEVGGLTDLQRSIIRCVGDPDRRFAEDALRILRAARFASTLEFEIEEDTLRSAIKRRASLAGISRERILQEWTKLLTGAGAKPILLRCRAILDACMPQLAALDCDAYRRAAAAVGASAPDFVTRMAALCSPLPAALRRELITSLKMDRERAQSIDAICDRVFAPLETDYDLIKLLSQLGPQDAARLSDVRRALSLPAPKDGEARLDRFLREGLPLHPRDLAIGGDLLIQMGVPAGPAIGAALHQLLEGVWRGELLNRPEDLCGAIRKIL